MKLLRQLKLADFFTLGNFGAGMLSILCSLNDELDIAAFLLIAAFVFDFLDGRVARFMNSQNKFGKELDSLGDLVSFGVAPAVFGFAAGLTQPWHMAILVGFAACGMLRLARFNILNIKGFIGVPITVNGIVFPIIYFSLKAFDIGFNDYVVMVYFLMAVLMISDVRVKKI
ncbi:MAG: CDP-diacylglycerol--serine O-phosphatidyltransferase [Nanoarchaeota archaeon]